MGIMPDIWNRVRARGHGMAPPLAEARSCQGVIFTAERAGETMGQRDATLAKI